jgi:predicted metal-dependent hydrolase
MNDKCYSYNEEDFTDYESAIESALENFFIDNPTFEGETEFEIFEGDQIEHKIGDFLPWLVDGIAENAFEAGDEYADNWSNKIEKLEKEIQETLKTALNKWADQTNNQPDFFGVKNVRPITVKIKIDKSGNWEDITP